MDMMMTSNFCKNGNNNSTATAFVHQQQEPQHQQMQEATVVPQVVEAARHVFGDDKKPQAPQLDEPLKCPRCQSDDTRFAYYNNYNMSQPRYLCKGCRRYWTHGGSLRNIPIGGRSRKNKRTPPLPSSSSGSCSTSDKQNHLAPTSCAAESQDVLSSFWAAEPQNFPNVLPTFMSNSFEMPPFTPTLAPALPSGGVSTPSFLDMLTREFVYDEGNNNLYGSRSGGMNVALFGSGVGEGATSMRSGGATATHQGGQVAGAGEQREDAGARSS